MCCSETQHVHIELDSMLSLAWIFPTHKSTCHESDESRTGYRGRDPIHKTQVVLTRMITCHEFESHIRHGGREHSLGSKKRNSRNFSLSGS